MAPSVEDNPGADPLDQSDAELLADCDVHRYRASGPGGPHRNKVESAVRLKHRPSGLAVVATESRSQHENRARALRRLRMAIALSVESPADPAAPPPAWLAACIDRRGGLHVGKRHEHFHAFVRWVVSLLLGHEGRVGPAARHVGVSTSQLIEFMRSHRKLWARANALRTRFALKCLK